MTQHIYLIILEAKNHDNDAQCYFLFNDCGKIIHLRSQQLSLQS